jgi:hypothetical protein
VGIGIAALVIVVIVLLLRRAADRPTDTVSAEADLLHLCHGDRSQMERLISLERKSAPDLSRSVAITRAAHSLRRDRR